MKKISKKTSKKDTNLHQQPAEERAFLHEKREQNWKNRMDSQHKNMSRGAEDIATIIHVRDNYGNKYDTTGRASNLKKSRRIK